MKISYNQATDSLYIHLADCASVESDEVQDDVVLDFDTSGALVGIDLQHASKRMDINNQLASKLPLGQLQAASEGCGTEAFPMKSPNFENDDILQIRLSEKRIVRKTSQGCHTNISYAEDGTVVEIVLLDAKKESFLSLENRRLV